MRWSYGTQKKNAENRRHGSAGLIDESVMKNKLTSFIIDAAIEVHRVLGGPRHLESIYEDALSHELDLRNIPFKRQHLSTFISTQIRASIEFRTTTFA